LLELDLLVGLIIADPPSHFLFAKNVTFSTLATANKQVNLYHPICCMRTYLFELKLSVMLSRA